MSQARPDFADSPFFVPEPGNWHLKPGAPEEVKKEFEEYMLHGANQHLGPRSKVKRWYKNNESDLIWWKKTPDSVGEWLFSFDKKTEFNLFADYPHNLTPEQKKTFDAENPEWKDFFKDRQ